MAVDQCGRHAQRVQRAAQQVGPLILHRHLHADGGKGRLQGMGETVAIFLCAGAIASAAQAGQAEAGGIAAGNHRLHAKLAIEAADMIEIGFAHVATPGRVIMRLVDDLADPALGGNPPVNFPPEPIDPREVRMRRLIHVCAQVQREIARAEYHELPA